jgi:hypothetical protein
MTGAGVYSVSSVAGIALLLVYALSCIAAHPMLEMSAAIAACPRGLWCCLSSCAAFGFNRNLALQDPCYDSEYHRVAITACAQLLCCVVRQPCCVIDSDLFVTAHVGAP